ncbi:MAG: single-stranded DNA-binding protein [Butyrivibrio sp.]|nr:single-stranded DNA-binding protein [Butyrivibrio sp.]
MNKVILMGRLTKDPDVRYSQGENASAIARYTLAVDRRFQRRNDPDAQSADFISCVAFGKSGEFAEKYLHKGTKIAVEGRIQTGSYVNRDGAKVYTTEVVVENQEFAESKNANGGGGGYSRGGYDRGDRGDYGAPSADAGIPQAPSDGFMNIPDGIDEELPFA